jgi:hypothetical protein
MNAVTERLVFEESERLLASQETALAGLRSRAGTLIAAASLVTAFLAPPALEAFDPHTEMTVHRFDMFAWLATASFVGVLIAALGVLLPYGWIFGHSAHKLMDDLLDVDPPADEATVLRHLAYYNDVNHTSNAKKMWKLFLAFALGCALLVAEVAFWLASLA